MDTPQDKHWRVIRTVELGASRDEVWELIGGFYTLHHWHPDISLTDFPPGQLDVSPVRRLLSFPGQPKTTEELVSMDNADCHYTYKWHAGTWGEAVKNYHSSLRVFAGDIDSTCVVQWIGEFDHPTDAISDFYQNGFRTLLERFPMKARE